MTHIMSSYVSRARYTVKTIVLFIKFFLIFSSQLSSTTCVQTGEDSTTMKGSNTVCLITRVLIMQPESLCLHRPCMIVFLYVFTDVSYFIVAFEWAAFPVFVCRYWRVFVVCWWNLQAGPLWKHAARLRMLLSAGLLLRQQPSGVHR